MFESLKTSDSRRKYIIEEDGAKCNHCGLSEWRGQPITLELEHRDGNSQNNVRANCEMICPNCHSQTLTWRGRNKNRTATDEKFIAALRDHRSICAALNSMSMAAKGGNYRRAKRLIAENNIEMRHQNGMFSPEQVATIKAMRAGGEMIKTIVEQMGGTRKTISDLLKGKSYKEV